MDYTSVIISVTSRSSPPGRSCLLCAHWTAHAHTQRQSCGATGTRQGRLGNHPSCPVLHGMAGSPTSPPQMLKRPARLAASRAAPAISLPAPNNWKLPCKKKCPWVRAQTLSWALTSDGRHLDRGTTPTVAMQLAASKWNISGGQPNAWAAGPGRPCALVVDG